MAVSKRSANDLRVYLRRLASEGAFGDDPGQRGQGYDVGRIDVKRVGHMQFAELYVHGEVALTVLAHDAGGERPDALLVWEGDI